MKDRADKTSQEKLTDLLRRAGESPTGLSGVQAEGDDESLRRELLGLSRALAASASVDEAHFDLEALTRFAKERIRHGETWEMPAHLSRCPLCLESFQILLEGAPKPNEAAIERFAGIMPKIVPFPARWKTVLKIAAAIVAVVGAAFFLQPTRHTSARVTEGGLAFETGQVLPHGATIPDGTALVARDPASATFADGSRVDFSGHTAVTFHETFRGSATVGLETGTVVATVAKQPKGREFKVRTPLGEVIVVGTRFRVTCAGENVMVFQSGGDRTDTRGRQAVVRAVRVTVFEGIVRVKTHNDEARVAAGQTAVVRENEPGIEISGGES